MPIWSLTTERIEKLSKQIGDMEGEIDKLIKLTKEDLWLRDLDAFINEWRFQLEDEERLRKKAANMGRRASNKLKIGAKGPAAKKRKAQGEDPDDSDFGQLAVMRKPKPQVCGTVCNNPSIIMLTFCLHRQPKLFSRSPTKFGHLKRLLMILSRPALVLHSRIPKPQ